MRPLIKICGTTRAEDVVICSKYGADILGFVVDYPKPVPWNLSIEQAKELIAGVPVGVRTCVVTGGSAEKIIRLTREIKPDFIQLHYKETPQDVAEVVKELSDTDIKVIKFLPVDSENLTELAIEYEQTGCYALLYDPRNPETAHEGGKADVPAYLKLKEAVKCPVILAGGITPCNVAELISQAKPPIIDLMTGVEETHGVKDEEKVKMLFLEILVL
jgi:phosphoribosylanthranilate isomerase